MSWQAIMNIAAVVGLFSAVLFGVAGVTMIVAGAKAKTEWRAKMTVDYNLPANYWTGK